MSEALVGILIFMAVIAITTVVFWAWLFVVLVRLAVRGMKWTLGLFFPDPASPPPLPDATVVCTRSRCRAINPATARFCRRCGRELLQSQVSRRQAALW